MTGGCEPFCVWNSELTTDDVEFAIELDDFPAWANDVKKIFTDDLKENGKAPDRCVTQGLLPCVCSAAVVPRHGMSCHATSQCAGRAGRASS
jgi:hypothetical protein